jgi:Tol biopolymer transport system component
MKKTILAMIIAVMLIGCGSGPTGIVPTPNPSAPADDVFVTTSCATIYPAVPDNVKLKGSAVLDDYKLTSHLFLKNLENGSEIPLATPNDTVSDIYVSPDHNSIGYQLGNPKNEWSLIVADAQGNRKTAQIWQKGFFILGNWISNDEILLLTFPPFVAFNPYTKQEKDFDYPDFPDYSLNARNSRVVAFDPLVERAVYKNTSDKVTFYDIPNKKILAQVDNHPNPSIIAAWAPDNSQVAVAGTVLLTSDPADRSDDLFSITRDGQVKRLTHLSDHYGKLVSISKSGLSWSPDSHAIAFWIAYRQNRYDSWELAVYDSTTQKTTNYCISNDYENVLNSTHNLPAPAWSADGKQLMIENRYTKDDSRVLILDLAQKSAYQIAENMYPAGWLTSETP